MGGPDATLGCFLEKSPPGYRRQRNVNMRSVIILYLIFILCARIIIGNHENLEQQKAVRESFNLLRQLPHPILEELGFKTRRMINQSSLGNPLPAYIVWSDSLKTFTEDNKPGEILPDVKEINYPVYACEMPISSVTIRNRKGKWVFAAIGGKEVLYAEHARKIHAGPGATQESSYFMVQVQIMVLTFLGYYVEDKLYLIPTHELPYRLQNKTPGIVSMEGGNLQHDIIRPEDIDPDGRYTIIRTLRGKVPGEFNIR